MLSKLTQFDSKYQSNNHVFKEIKKLSNSLSKFLPQEYISKTEMIYACVDYFDKKSLKMNWQTNVDCYLGIPNHIEKYEELSQCKYKVFPLLLIYKIALRSYNEFSFCLLREETLDGTTLNGSKHLMHFNSKEFIDFSIEFSNRLERKEVNAYKHFFDDEKGIFYMQDEDLDQKLIDDKYEFSYYYKEALLNDYFYENLDRLRKSIFSNTLKFYLELCAGGFSSSIFSIYKEDKKTLSTIEKNLNKWSILDFYEFVKDFKDPHIKYLYDDLKSFLVHFYSYYSHSCEMLEDEDNHIIEGDIEMIEQLVKNTENKIFIDTLGHDFSKPNL